MERVARPRDIVDTRLSQSDLSLAVDTEGQNIKSKFPAVNHQNCYMMIAAGNILY